MTELEQYKQEVRERLKKIFKASGKSSRAFSESIGLKPTSFHKVLTGPAGLTIPLANSIELKHGYRAEWILNGKGNMKVYKRSQLSPLEICFLDVSFSSSQKWSILELLIFEKLNKNIDDFQNKIGDSIFTSGLGGIFLKDIEIGMISAINSISINEIEVVITLKTDPLEENFFGMIGREADEI